jgi:ApbE superfamily uncharacterized protein (UPF0280 family)
MMGHIARDCKHGQASKDDTWAAKEAVAHAAASLVALVKKKSRLLLPRFPSVVHEHEARAVAVLRRTAADVNATRGMWP